MSQVDNLIEREKAMLTPDFFDRFDVGYHVLGLEPGIDKLTNDSVQAWEDFHDRWDVMDQSEKDTWLVLLALKGL